MRRVLCGLLLGVLATAAPAAAVEGVRVTPDVKADENGVGVGTQYSTDGGRSWQPGAAARVSSDGEVCAGFGHQVPICAGGPIS